MPQSNYMNLFVGKSRKERLTTISDFYNLDSYKHYMRCYIRDDKSNDTLVDWKRKYVTLGYFNMVINEYVEYIQVLKDIVGFKDTIKKNDKNTLKKNLVFETFLKRNNWNSLFKTIAKNRKLYGDVYLYWFKTKDKESGVDYLKFKILDSRYMTPKVNSDGDIHAYEYERTTIYQEKIIANDDIRFEEKTKNVKWVFINEGLFIYEDGRLVERIPNAYKNTLPIVHFQYLKEDDSDSPYSIIPSEPLIDLSLLLDRLETALTETNAQSGSPQMIVVDGDVMSDSLFGPNGIVYVQSRDINSVENEDGDLEYNPNMNSLNKQAQVKQLEITNGLVSIMTQKNDCIYTIYTKANLIPPTILEKLSGNDSMKAISAIKSDLEQEVKDFYEEFSSKMEPVLTVLFKMNGLIKDEKIYFKIPETALNSTIFDKYLLKAQKMNLGELTVRGNLRNMGMSEEEIEKHIDEINQEKYENNKDISIQKATAEIKAEIVKNDVKGVDNNTKKVGNVEINKQKTQTISKSKGDVVEEKNNTKK